MKAKTLISLAGNIIAAVSLYFLVDVFISNYAGLQLELSFDIVLISLFILVLGILSYSIIAYCWYMQLTVKYPAFSVVVSMYIFGISQIAKYLPGNVGHLIGRSYLACKHGVSMKDSAVSLLVEGMAMAVVSLLFGFYYLVVHGSSVIDSLYETGVVVLIAVMISIFAYYNLREKLSLVYISPKILVIMLILLFISSLWGGAAVYILSNMSGIAHVTFIEFASGFSLAFVIGFLMPGAPGGIGVREFVFVKLFEDSLGVQFATEIIIFVRLISLIIDMLLFFIAYMYMQNSKR